MFSKQRTGASVVLSASNFQRKRQRQRNEVILETGSYSMWDLSKINRIVKDVRNVETILALF